MRLIDYLKDIRISALIIIVVALLLLDLHYGVHLGIEFAGGTQIPVQLQQSVNTTVMSQLLTDLDQRLSTFGLKEITVEGVGTSEVYITLPSVSEAEINQSISIIQSQGRFDGIVDGVEAINGSGILKGSIGQLPPQVENNTVGWTVTFFVTQSAANSFAKAAFGQANQPIYLFLDRPINSIVIINESQISNTSLGIGESEGFSALKQALYWKSSNIPIIAVSNSNSSIASTEAFLIQSKEKYNNIIISDNLPSLISFIQTNSLISSNYTIKEESNANMTPSYITSANGTTVDSWTAVGLLSGPILNPGITNGNISESYEITGAAPASVPKSQQVSYATLEAKKIASVLSGGALPVAVIPGTPESIPPTLGKRFLYVSGVALLAAVIAISIFIMFRYRHIFLVAPILLTTFVELFIIISIIGLIGTIDLAAVAGMIAVVGTGVDAQIIITDEVLSKETNHSSAKVLLGHAFYIVWADAAILIIAMLPLFFSTSLVTVIGFSESTIIGALLGVIVTRPAYGAIISKKYST